MCSRIKCNCKFLNCTRVVIEILYLKLLPNFRHFGAMQCKPFENVTEKRNRSSIRTVCLCQSVQISFSRRLIKALPPSPSRVFSIDSVSQLFFVPGLFCPLRFSLRSLTTALFFDPPRSHNQFLCNFSFFHLSIALTTWTPRILPTNPPTLERRTS